MDLISVIVPIYKVEAYLDRCVQSIVDQTYKNLEIILVDDGSPDRCPEMCDIWAKKDPRIRVIHQANAGAGAARNAGLAIATGEIITFVDSDDYISPVMYEHLVELLTPDTDIVECDFLLTDSLTARFDIPSTTSNITNYTAVEAMLLHIHDTIFRQTIWNKLYRRHVVGGHQFPVRKLIDDEFWTYRVLGNAKVLKHSPAKLYAYVQQPGSVMHISYSLRRLQAVEAKIERLQYLKNHFPTLHPQAATNLWSTCLYHGQMSLLHLDESEEKQALSILKNTIRSIRYSDIRGGGLSLIYIIWFFLSKFNFRITCNLRNHLKIGL